MSNEQIFQKHVIDVVKYRWVWFILSALMILPGIGAMIYSSITYDTHYPLNVGVDFTGGTVLQYGIKNTTDTDAVATEDKTTVDKKDEQSADVKKEETAQVDTTNKLGELRDSLGKIGIENPNIQSLNVNNIQQKNTKNTIDSVVSIRTKFVEEGSDDVQKITEVMSNVYGNSELIQVNSIGPTLGAELFKNSLFALTLAFLGIVAYLTIRFQLDYAVIAVLALLHDAFFIVGTFSILGLLFGLQIDSLFITALLTVIGFSVHDTIVVFDRVRENTKFLKKKHDFSEIVNASVNQTLARSINTSLTTLITLLALYIFGGVTTKDFVLAMILGIAIGTYSSIFFASALLAWWREKKANEKVQKRA